MNRTALAASTGASLLLASSAALALEPTSGHASAILSDTTPPAGHLALSLQLDGAHEALAFVVGEDQLDSTGFSRGATGNLLGLGASARFSVLDALELSTTLGWRFYDVSFEGVHTAHGRVDARARILEGDGLRPGLVVFAGAGGTYAKGLVFAPSQVPVGRLIVHLRPGVELDFGDVGQLTAQAGLATGVRLGPVAVRLALRAMQAWVHGYDVPSPSIIDRLDGIFTHQEQVLRGGIEVASPIAYGLSTALGYEYIGVRRQGLDFQENGAPVTNNHVFGASLSYALTRQLQLSALGTIYWNNLTGEVPLFYNELNASQFRHHYGALHAIFAWTMGD